MVTLGIVIAIVCFLYLSLLALLRAGRERRVGQRLSYKKLPRVSQEVISTLGAEFKKAQDQGNNQMGYNCTTEFKEEQPFLYVLLVEVLKQIGDDDLQGIAPAFMVYKLLKAQMEADLLDRSLRH